MNRNGKRQYFSFAQFITVCLIFVLFSFDSSAQKIKTRKDRKTIHELSELSLEDLMNTKVITASKTEETIREAPSSISVFTKEQIDNMGITNVYDLLNYVPGFQTTKDIALAETEVFHVRGIAGLKPYVLVQIDGERINDLFIERGTQFLPYLPTANIKQVEVIAGPASALYGSDAVLGIINIITEHKENQFNLKGGSQESFATDVSAFTKINKDLELSASAFHYTDNGYKYTINGKTTNDAKNGNGFNVLLKYKNLEFNSFFYENRFDDFIKYTNQVENGLNENKTGNVYMNLSWKKTFTNKLEIKVKSRYIRRNWSPFGLVSPAVPEAGFSYPFYFGVVITTGDFQNSCDLNYKINDKHQLLLGVSHRLAGTHSIVTRTNYFTPDEQVIPSDSYYQGEIIEYKNRLPEENFTRFINIFGVYGQYRVNIIKNLKANLGVRYDYFEIGGQALNPRISFNYNTKINSTIKAMYGRAFRSPSYNELFSNDPVTVGNVKLNPEYSRTCEVGYYQKLNQMMLIATYFNNSISNLIKEIPNSSGPATFENSDSTINSSGIELSLQAHYRKAFLVGLCYTYIIEGSDKSFPDFASFHLNYRIKNLNVNLNGIYRNEFIKLTMQDPYVLLNAKIRYKVSETLELNASVQNMFDYKYNTYSERLSAVGAAIPNRGREWSFGLRISLE